MKMKKTLAAFLAVAMVFSLAACGDRQSAPDHTADPIPAQTAPASAETPSAEDRKALVVYFSAQNHTEAVAQTIAEHMGADIFELIPTVPYTEDDLNWRDEDSRVCREHDDPALQTIELETITPDNWADYDIVFVGYPIWWQNASWVVTTFVSANDFEGKTVIPFCTSSSSGYGESGKNLATAANGGDWREGIRFRSSVDPADVTAWLDELEL